IPREVFLTGQSQIVGNLLDLESSHDQTIAAGIRHVLCVPLSISPIGTGGPQGAGLPRTIGVLYLDGQERSTMLSPQTRSSLEAFATQAALAIDSARLYAEAAEKARLEHDLLLAARIQRALLPAPRFETTWVELVATSIPCRTIGGDFFDYLDLPGGHFGFVLGDVAGKGPSAALLAAAVQSNFAAQASTPRDPGEIVANINRALLRRAIEARFAAMFFGVVTPGGRLAYCNAGQEPPLVVRRDGRVDRLDSNGPVVGILDFARYGTDVVALHAGDLVIVYSDGVTEAGNAAGEYYGRDRLAALVADRHGDPAAYLLDRLVASVNEFVGKAPQLDDLTAMVLHYRGP
ncbi:MAG: SpoIIE family protein phosphatase, partial [Acidobacteriota bacterium]|nr:SpoIIE family protein phosphatase [Acidobacteriota bacterium]